MAMSFAFRAQVRAPVRVAPVRVAVRPVAFLTRVPSVNVVPKSAAPMSFGLVSSTSSAFLGGSLVQRTSQPRTGSRGMLTVVAGKVGGGMPCTKRGTKRKRRRVSGFRTRLQTTSGRAVLRRRRQKGRKELSPASVGGRK